MGDERNQTRWVSRAKGTAPSLKLLAMLLSLVACAGERGVEADQVAASDEAALLSRYGHGRPDGRLAVRWNELAYQVAFAEDQFLTFKGVRTFSMMNLAIHDALNSIVPLYEPYSHSAKGLGVADPTAAAAQAAYEVLRSQYPGEEARFASELAAWLGELADDKPKRLGIALGRDTATAILHRREGDGWDTPGSYTFQSGPGHYQTTPPWNGFVVQPGFRFARPFALKEAAQFRPGPPPGLATHAYAQAVEEVKAQGAAKSQTRTADQTGYAVWWMEFAEGSINRLARQMVADRRMNLWTAARLFARLNLSLFDVYVATWDSKYTYDHWRPYTAIRQGATDGNDETLADPAWESLRPATPFPEYVSAHAASCAAAFGVLENAFGKDVAFRMTTTTAPPGMPSRFFSSFDAAAEECADSRVQLGFHFRYSTNGGLALGRKVVGHVLETTLRPSRRGR